MTGGTRVATGLDVLVSERFRRLDGRRVGLIANPTTVDRQLRHAADLLASAPVVTHAALFGPEHGVRADAQDLIGVPSGHDSKTGVVVHSLYGSEFASLTPTGEQIAGLDVLVFDVQDVGSRYYTFAATMKYAMIAAARAGIGFMVLDRPNPIGGAIVEGPTIRPGFASFVGAHPLPIRHGMTVGELARLFRADLGLDLDLEVVPCEGLTRAMTWAETGLPWVLPSPNMPTPETAAVYPGGCLVEGTNLSEGRGTTRPFELWGAPWLDPDRLATELNRALRDAGCSEGLVLRPCGFRPTFQKHVGSTCGGVQIHVTDPTAFRPAAVYATALAVARNLDPGRFAWRTEVYEFVSDPIAIDLLFGSGRERALIDEAGPPSGWARDLFEGEWARESAEFAESREPFLLYGPGSSSSRAVLAFTLLVDGAVARPLRLGFADLAAMPEGDQIPDVARFHPGRDGDGVSLRSLLDRAGIDRAATHLTLHADRDDFHASIPLAEVADRGMVVYRSGGGPLPKERGGPIRFLIRDPSTCRSADLDDCANVKYLSRIELTIGKGRDSRPLDDAEHEALHAGEK